jgi:hypothetical protein
MVKFALTRLLVGSAGVLMASSATLAHHSFAAQYDSNQLVELQGKVTKVEWMNPHTFFYIDVVGEDGTSANWAIEGGAPNVLYRRGWRPTSLAEGDELHVTGHKARDGSNLVRGLTFGFTDGRCLFFGVAELGGEASEDCSD